MSSSLSSRFDLGLVFHDKVCDGSRVPVPQIHDTLSLRVRAVGLSIRPIDPSCCLLSGTSSLLSSEVVCCDYDEGDRVKRDMGRLTYIIFFSVRSVFQR